MPPFFSKVFARGKEKDKEKGKDGLKEPASPTAKQFKRNSRASSLLEGKFEAVSPSVSPTAEKYEDKDQTPKKDKEKERIGLFRPKSRSTSVSDASKKQEDVPKLTLNLNLPSTKNDSKKRDLGIVYEGDTILDDAVLGEKRLSPAEALKLMRACLTALTSRGLETLGVMHPHWHSASPTTQRKIISLFLSSLVASSDSSAPNRAASAFDSELEYARSPHDVAAVFRWALRHLKLDADTFDKENTPSLAWYDNFTDKEKATEYPRTAYSDILLPIVKPSHAELLDSTLSLVSRLASHSEWNGVSGSKLSMFFGLYLLTGNRVEGLEDWLSFYSHWERAGRALEHIFLASLRDEDSKTGIPKRLSELVVNYPFAKSAVDKQFPRPTRFATRAHDALLIRITGESSPGRDSQDELYLPLQVVEHALKADLAGISEDAELVVLWEDVRKLSGILDDGATDNPDLEKSLGRVFSDETIRILSLKSDGSEKGTPTISMFSPVPKHEALFGPPIANGRAKAANGSTSVSRHASEATASSPIIADWSTFTSAGFGEAGAGQSLAATLLDKDLEKTDPPKILPRRSLKKSRSPGRTSRAEKTELRSSPTSGPVHFKAAQVSLVKVDEAFIDFWSDAFVDPISDTWPTFVVCQLKSDAVRTHGDKKVGWLVIEQKLVATAPPAPPSPARRASSPRPSVRSNGENRPGVVSRVSATFSPRKRFNFFGGQASTVSGTEKRESKAISKGMKVNELGEVIPEEKSLPPSPVSKTEESKPKSTPPKDDAPVENAKKPDDVAVGAAAVAVGAGALAVGAKAAAAHAPESGKADVPSQDKEVKEPVEEGPTDQADTLPPVAAPQEHAGTEEPVAEHQEAADDAHIEDQQVTEATVSHPDDAPNEVVEVAESTRPQSDAIPEEVTEVEEPAALPPQAPPSEAELPTTASAEEVVSQPSQVVEPIAEQPSASVQLPPIETEGSALGAHHGAGESRFVEHIELTPPDEKPAALEPPIAEQDVPDAEGEPIAPVLSVPETIQEEAPEPAAADGNASVDKDDAPIPVERTDSAKADDSIDVEEHSTPATEIPVPAATTAEPETSPPVEELALPSASEDTKPAEPVVATDNAESTGIVEDKVNQSH